MHRKSIPNSPCHLRLWQVEAGQTRSNHAVLYVSAHAKQVGLLNGPNQQVTKNKGDPNNATWW